MRRWLRDNTFASHLSDLLWSRSRVMIIKGIYHSHRPSIETETVQLNVHRLFGDETCSMCLTAPNSFYLLYNTCLSDLISRKHLHMRNLIKLGIRGKTECIMEMKYPRSLTVFKFAVVFKGGVGRKGLEIL